MTATDRQISYLKALADKAGFESIAHAADDYGFGRVVSADLTKRQASEMIEWLTGGARPSEKIAEIEMGTRFRADDGDGKIISRLSDGNLLVKYDDGRSAVVEFRSVTL